ncbi:hypothetical protein QQ045_022930 [Rhodiola kirilowii]
MGDFNEVTYSWEMDSKRERQAWQMKIFRDCLDDCELSDMGFKGRPFTYSNRRKGENEVKARLNRVLENERWRTSYPRAVVKHGRFEPIWLRHKEFKEEVRRAWSDQIDGAPLSAKLKRCMQSLHQWGSSTFGSVRRKVNDLKKSIQEVREKPRTEESAKVEANLEDELDEWLEREELWGRQRSRAEWLQHGDRNTAYFHEKASQRRRRNHIDRIKDQAGEFCEAETQIASIITNYFQEIFLSQVDALGERWSREFEIIPKVVTEEMNEALNAPFTEGEEVVKEVLNCLNHGVLNAELNDTLIVLVPKVKKAEKVVDLRPISLCNVVMKVITKVLANRLKIVLPEIISQNQSA